MLVGHVDGISRTEISGWAADSAHPGVPVAVRVTANGVRRRVVADLNRNDLAAAFEGATGSYGFHLAENPLPLSPYVDHEIEVAFARTGEVLPGGRTILRALGSPLSPLRRAGRPSAVVITTTGRTGSSLLMARLARHPEILVGRDHPHELKLLSYYAMAFNTLVSPADRDKSTDPDTMLAVSKRYFIGHNPYHDLEDRNDGLMQPFWDIGAPNLLRDCFIELIDEYYRLLSHKFEKPNARFFAEKIGTSEHVLQAGGFMFGRLHEIILVRDPRDIICSSKSFWQRDFAHSVSSIKGQFVSMSRPRSPGVAQYVLHYEDLVTKPDEAMGGVLAFLGLYNNAVDRDADTENAVFQMHGTTASPEATIGRWRRELTDEEVAMANAELAPYLQRFGYV